MSRLHDTMLASFTPEACVRKEGDEREREREKKWGRGDKGERGNGEERRERGVGRKERRVGREFIGWGKGGGRRWRVRRDEQGKKREEKRGKGKKKGKKTERQS